MAYNSIISRADAEALLKEGLYEEIFQHPIEESIFAQLARRLPDAPAGKNHIRVLDQLPMAYFVNGDNGLKQTSKVAWEKAVINIEELAVIVPIPEAVIEDEAIDIFGQITPLVRQAFGQAMDGAILFGVNKPANWPLSIMQMARQAGNNVQYDSTNGVTYDKLLGDSGVFSKVESAGGVVNGSIAALSMRASLRGIKDDNGYPIFKSDMQGSTSYALDGAPTYFPRNGSFDSSKALILAGDWSQAVWCVRRDLDVKILDQAIIQDGSGNIVYNLAQQDMVALRVTFRLGWTLPNPASPTNPNRILVPFAYLEPASPETTYSATLTVKHSSTAQAGVKVNVEGARKITDANGQVVYNLVNGTYAYTAESATYGTASGTFTINGANVTANVAV